MNLVTASDRKHFPLFVREFEEFKSLLEEWQAAENRIEEHRLAMKMLNRMRSNGWG